MHPEEMSEDDSDDDSEDSWNYKEMKQFIKVEWYGWSYSPPLLLNFVPNFRSIGSSYTSVLRRSPRPILMFIPYLLFPAERELLTYSAISSSTFTRVPGRM